ncbi:MAG TPA: WD40 repeat domain-containing protein [Ktedonobacteraceae bacterium]
MLRLGAGAVVLVGAAAVGGGIWLVSRPQVHYLPQTRIIRVPTPGADYIYRGHSAAVTTLAWSPDGLYLASGSADKTVQVWQAASGARLSSFVGLAAPVTALAWDATSTSIASAGDDAGGVRVWKALQGTQAVDHTGQSGKVLSLAWPTPSTTWTTTPVNVILSGAEDGTVQVWDATSGKPTTSYIGQGSVRTLLYSSLDRVLLAGEDHLIHHWDISTAGDTTSTPATYEGHTDAINALTWIEENNIFASASDDGTVRVWSSTSSQSPALPTLTYRGHKGSVYTAVAYEGLIISGGQDHTVQLWRFDTGKLLYTYTGHQGPIRALAVAPLLGSATQIYTSVPFVASASDDGAVHIWRIPEQILAAGRLS